jgi:IclR family mhp operon transcriptional activator
MKKSPTHIRSVERAIELLQALNKQAVSTLDSLYRQTGLPKPTLVRLLRTLEAKQLVSQSSQYGNYFLTAGVNTLSCGYHHEPLIVEASAPIMEALTKKIRWPLSVAVFKSDAMIIRYSTISHSPWALLHSITGMHVSMVNRALGRAYLAFSSPAEQEFILQIVRQSEHPEDLLARDDKQMRKIINEIKKCGYALRNPAVSKGSATIAVPIFDEDRVVASLGLTWFLSAMTTKQIVDQHAVGLQKAAKDISARLKQLKASAKEIGVSAPLV